MEPQWVWENELEEAMPLRPEIVRQNLLVSPDRLKVFKVERWRWFSQELAIHKELSELRLQIVPQLYHHFKVKTDLVLVMERMDGNLFDLKVKRKYLFSKEIINGLINLLEQLHSFGVVHNDVSLCNFLYKGEKLYIADFGISIKWNPEKHNLDTWNIHRVLDYYMLYNSLLSLNKSCWPLVKECFVPVWKKGWNLSKIKEVPTLFELEKFPIGYCSSLSNSVGFNMKVIDKIEGLIASSLEQ